MTTSCPPPPCGFRLPGQPQLGPMEEISPPRRSTIARPPPTPPPGPASAQNWADIARQAAEGPVANVKPTCPAGAPGGLGIAKRLAQDAGDSSKCGSCGIL